MARIGTIQPSFAQGEISDRLFGRVDISQYQVAAARLENYIVRPEGGLTHRHGTRFGGETKDHTKRPWLIDFIVSETIAYQVEFGDLYCRFWKNYAQITSASATLSNITQANPAVVTYVGADIFANGNRIVITSVAGMGQVNNREFAVANVNVGANTFELSGVNSTGYDAYTSGGTAAIIYEIVSPYVEADLPKLKRLMEMNLRKTEVDVLRFKWFHFYGSYWRYRIDGGWFQKQDRIVRNDGTIESCTDAFTFCRKDGKDIRRQQTNCFIYHYGWVQSPELMRMRRVNAEDIGFVQLSEKERQEAYAYGDLGRYPIYFGTHPSVMKERIDHHQISQEDLKEINRQWWWYPPKIFNIRYKSGRRMKAAPN